MSNKRISPWCAALLMAVMASAFIPRAALAAESESPPEKEQKLIAVLRSDAPKAEKAITCKHLAIYGNKDAVSALAPLLTDAELSSWARIALEAIPDPAAGEALRAAVPKVEGRLLIGVMNSLAVRHDREAVSALASKLQDANDEVASAAAEALGKIGGPAAVKALEAALASAPAGARSSVAYGCVLCAEQLLNEGRAREAAALCDQVRRANVPKQRILEATRGAILARGSEGVPLLVEQLKSADMGLFNIGVRTARELPGREATQALAKELDQATADRQIPLLLALADRTDAAVLPKILQVAEGDAKPLRLTALGLLDRFSDLACVPVLLKASTEPDADLSRTAKTVLGRFGGKEVDSDLLARLRLASGNEKRVLIELAGNRRLDAAIPAVLRSTEDSNADVRRTAVETLGILGTERQAGALVNLLSATRNADELDDVERALTAICRRKGAGCLPAVLPLAKEGPAALRKVGLRALSSIGGSEALGVVKNAIADPSESLQDEAVNLLSTWPNTWPEDSDVAEPLLALAKSGKKPAYKAQGLSGYLHYIEETKGLNNDEKVVKLKDLLAQAADADQKRQIISVFGTVPAPSALETLMDLAKDEAVAEESFMAAVKVAADRRTGDRELRRKTLQSISEKSQNDSVKKQATDALKRLR